MRFLKAIWQGREVEAVRERRAVSRTRTRLRPGKLLDRELRFFADCAIIDRTADGVRVRCFADIAAADEHLAVFDEKDRTVRPGRIVWRDRADAGIRLDGAPSEVDTKAILALSAPYYAVKD